MSKSTSSLANLAVLIPLGMAVAAFADDTLGDLGDRRADILDAYDADGDGRLTGTELDDFREVQGEKRAEHKARMRERHDADGDGKLSQDEREAARESRRLERWDSDGDGALSDDERAVGRDERSRRHEAKLEKYDADGDGRLGRSERQAARDDGAKLGRRGAKHRGRGHGGGPPSDAL